MTPNAAAVDVFARWFRDHRARLHGLAASEAADEIAEALLRVDAQLGVEVADGGSEVRELILTAYSDGTRFLLVQRIAAALGPSAGWTIIALKPARGFDFELTLGASVVRAASLRFVPMPGVGHGVRLLVDAAMPIPDRADAEEIAWLVVETGIGEELAARLAHVELGHSAGDSGERAIIDLAEHVRDLP
jgi:hypothetical protein